MNETATMGPAVPEVENAPVGGIQESPVSDAPRTNGDASVGEGLAPPVPDDRQAETEAGGASPAPTSLPPEMAEDHAIRAHFDALWREAEVFSREVPGFDFAEALADDAFAALLDPRRGLTLEQAYFVRHGRELLAAAERAAASRVSAALQSSRRVPAPLGSAAAVSGFRWDKNASPEARAELKARIRKGEKVYPGR